MVRGGLCIAHGAVPWHCTGRHVLRGDTICNTQKRGRSPANTAGGASSAGHAAPPVPNLRIADRVAPEAVPTGAVPRYSPVGDIESSADHDEMDAESPVTRSTPRAADIELGEEIAYNSVNPDEETH